MVYEQNWISRRRRRKYSGKPDLTPTYPSTATTSKGWNMDKFCQGDPPLGLPPEGRVEFPFLLIDTFQTVLRISVRKRRKKRWIEDPTEQFYNSCRKGLCIFHPRRISQYNCVIPWGSQFPQIRTRKTYYSK